VLARQPAMAARLRVFAAEHAPARVTILRRVHVDQALFRSAFLAGWEEWLILVTLGAGTNGNDEVTHR